MTKKLKFLIICIFLAINLEICFAEKITNINFTGSAKDLIALIVADYKLNVVLDYSAIIDDNDKIMISLNNVEPIDVVKEASKLAGFEIQDKGYLLKIFSRKSGKEKKIMDRIYTEKIKVYTLNYIDAASAANILTKMFAADEIKVEIIHFEQDKIEMSAGSASSSTSNTNESSGGIEQTLGKISKSTKPSNKILVKAPENYFEIIDKILDESDNSPQQVLIKVVIAELSSNLTDEIGIKWEASGQFKYNANFATGAEKAAATNNYNFSTLNKIDMNGLLKLISSDKKSKILSRPYVLTLNNELAQIKVTDKLPYVSSYTQSGSGVDLVLKPEVKIEEFGIKLSVLPRISANKTITLEIYPSVTDFIRFETFGTGNTQTKVPFVSVREAYTKLLVNDGDVIVIGGLVSNKNVKTNENVPFLSNIPLIGKLFTSKSRSKESTELIMFISAHIVDEKYNKQILNEINDELKSEIKK